MHARLRSGIRGTRWIALALTLPVAAACAAEEDAEVQLEEGVGVEAPPTGETMPDEGIMMEPVTVQFASKNESGVTGEATTVHRQDSASVELMVMGAGQDGSFPAHVHSGTCDETGGVLLPLNAVEVTGGTGSSTTTVAMDQVPEGQEAVIQVHDPSGQPVACADLMGHGGVGGPVM